MRLFALMDLGQPMECFKRNRERGKMGLNQDEVSSHDAKYNKQSQVPSFQGCFLKDISFRYIRKNCNYFQLGFPCFFLF